MTKTDADLIASLAAMAQDQGQLDQAESQQAQEIVSHLQHLGRRANLDESDLLTNGPGVSPCTESGTNLHSFVRATGICKWCGALDG